MTTSLDFRAALRACLMHAKGNLTAHRGILRDVAGWLGGDRVSPELKRLGVYNQVKITNVTEIVGAFLRFLLGQGYKGLVIMLDEADPVTSLTQSKRRNEANQNVRKLLDNADQHEGSYVIFATTPSFLTNPTRGAPSYPALWSRIRNVVNAGLQQVNKRSIIIPLEPLDSGELSDLGAKVIGIHSKAYEWDSSNYVGTQGIQAFTTRFAQKSEKKTVRSFVRVLVDILDQLEDTRDNGLFNSLLDQIEFKEDENTEDSAI